MKAARRMNGRLPKLVGRIWQYPTALEVLAAACLHTIFHYIQVRRHYIAKWVAGRPIYMMFQAEERRRGTTPCKFWWEQLMDLDVASMGAPTDVAVEEAGGGGPRILTTVLGARAT